MSTARHADENKRREVGKVEGEAELSKIPRVLNASLIFLSHQGLIEIILFMYAAQLWAVNLWTLLWCCTFSSIFEMLYSA